MSGETACSQFECKESCLRENDAAAAERNLIFLGSGCSQCVRLRGDAICCGQALRHVNDSTR